MLRRLRQTSDLLEIDPLKAGNLVEMEMSVGLPLARSIALAPASGAIASTVRTKHARITRCFMVEQFPLGEV